MMEVAQLAEQAGRSGVSVFLDAGIIGLIVTNSGLLIKALIDRRAVKKEKESEPQLPCQTHGDRLTTLEGHKMPTRLATLEANYLTSSKSIDDMRRENREDHGKIFDAINGLRDGK